MTQDEFIKKYSQNWADKVRDFNIDVYNYIILTDNTGKPMVFSMVTINKLFGEMPHVFHDGVFINSRHYQNKCDLAYIEELEGVNFQHPRRPRRRSATLRAESPDFRWYIMHHHLQLNKNHIVVCPFCAEHFFNKAI